MDDEAQKELEDLREEIDKIDLKFLEELAKFMRERMRIVEKVGLYKHKAGLAIPDKKREEEVMRDRAAKGRSKGLSGDMVERIFESIVRDSRERE